MTMDVTRRQLLRSAAALGAAAPFIGMAPGAVSAQDGRLVVRMDRDLQNLDPGNRTGPAEVNVILAVCQGLVKPKIGALDYELDAAASIEQVDPKLIEFTLKEGLEFTGGYGPLTAEDVKFSFERFIKPDAGGKKVAFADDWAALDHVEVTGPLSGRIHLKQPSAALWSVALADGSGAIISRKAFEALDGKIQGTPIGSGPYMLSEASPGSQFVLKANPGYSGSAQHFAEIVLKPIPELKTAELAFLGNELDFTEISPIRMAEIGKTANTRTVSQSGIDYVWFGPNIARAPFDKLEVRQALRMAVDVDAILAGAYNGLAPRANAILAPELLGYWKDAPVHRRDVDGAMALLEKAGLGSGFRTRLTILNNARNQAIATIIQANLAEVGIELEIDARGGGSYWSLGENDASRDLELSLVEYPGKTDPGFQLQWFTTSQIGLWNWQRWGNAEFDSLHARAGADTDPAARAAMYVEMQKLMDESAAFIWITNNVYAFAMRETVTPAILPSGANLILQDFRQA